MCSTLGGKGRECGREGEREREREKEIPSRSCCVDEIKASLFPSFEWGNSPVREREREREGERERVFVKNIDDYLVPTILNPILSLRATMVRQNVTVVMPWKASWQWRQGRRRER